MKILSVRKVADGSSDTTAKELPSAAVMAGNFMLAAVGEGAAIMKGVPPVSEEEAARRFAICQVCQYFRTQDERCTHSKCGCYVRRKTAWRAQKCPVGEW